MKGWGLVALVTAAAMAGAGIAADRVGPASPAAPPAATATSSSWICPHGGGPRWEGAVTIANPGSEPVETRITSLSTGASAEPQDVTVEPGSVLLQPIDASRRESATAVEAFGGWIAVGWMVRAADPDNGLSAEPCAPEAGATWTTTETSTEEGEEAYLIVANPFEADAVFDVVLFTPDDPPLRDPDWTDLVLRAGRSVALPMSRKVIGDAAVAANVRAKVGRIAVGTLGVSDGGGVRGVLGTRTAAPQWHLLTKAGAGQSTVITFVPDDRGTRFGGRLLSQREPQAAGDLVDAQQRGASTQVAPVVTRGPSSVVVSTIGDGTLVTALRAEGQSADDAATGGASMPSPAWILLPTVYDQPSFPGLVVENPGTEPVTVTLRSLPPSGPGEEVSFRIGPSATAGAPEGFFEGAPQAAVLVSATGPVVAAGVSTSAGVQGISLYAIAVGVPIPTSAAVAFPSAASAVP